MNIDIFIPVRLDSTRLPKKHLQLINGKPVLQNLIERMSVCKEIRHVIVCCTTDSTDDELVDFLKSKKIKFFRGNKKDIIQRFLDAAKKFDTDIIIDVEGDKIYTDPAYVDQIATKLKLNDLDFIIANDSKSIFNASDHFIHGIAPSGFTKPCLEKICTSKMTNDTETGYHEFFIKFPNINSEFLVIETNDFLNKIRLTLDYPEDLKLAEEIFGTLEPNFSKEELIKLFKENPHLLTITENVDKKWIQNYQENRTKLDF